MLNLRRDVFLALANWLLKWPGHELRRFFFQFVIGNSIGKNSYIERGCRVSGRGGVQIGDNCNVNRGVYLDGRGGLVIGDRVNISDEVMILTDEHDPDDPRFVDRPRNVHIGSRVWLASRATVMPGTTIGDGALIAAGGLARGQLEPNIIYVGVPARPVRSRDQNAQSALPPYKRFWR